MPEMKFHKEADEEMKVEEGVRGGREQNLCRERKNHTGRTGQRKKEQGSR